jgi:hypothetical protein
VRIGSRPGAQTAACINVYAESIVPLFEIADAPGATYIHAALLWADVFVSEPKRVGTAGHERRFS